MTAKQSVIVRQGTLFDLDSPLHGKVRGERSVMDFPFFALSKVAVHKPMEWKLGDVTIAIRPSATGMATMYDKEIILYIASLMAQEIAEGGQVDDTFTFTAHDFFRITGVPRPSKRDYQRFSEALERLQGTQVRTNIQTGSKIDRGWFSWLSEAQAQYHQLPNGDEVLRTVSVRLCGWLHRAISRDGQIYHYHHDYFRLGTIERRLYEIAHCLLGVDPQADRAVGERRWHAVAVAFEVHEAGRRHPCGVLDEAIEGASQPHQAGRLLGMHIGNSAWQHAVLDLAPLLDTAPLEPVIERVQIGKAGHLLP